MKKYIPYIIIAAVLVAFNYYTLSGLGQPLVEAHYRENISQYFTGSVLDWIGFTIFNSMLIAYCVVIALDKSTLTNPVGSNMWNYILVTALAASVSLIYLG